MLIYLLFKNMLVLCYTYQNMTYYAFTCFICTSYAIFMESFQTFVYGPTLGAVGIEFLVDEQDIKVVQHDPSFVQEWTADDVE